MGDSFVGRCLFLFVLVAWVRALAFLNRTDILGAVVPVIRILYGTTVPVVKVTRGFEIGGPSRGNGVESRGMK
jgi:hypothetical protein